MFFVFRDSYVLCIYAMSILCTFHVSVSWVGHRGRREAAGHFSLLRKFLSCSFSFFQNIILSVEIPWVPGGIFEVFESFFVRSYANSSPIQIAFSWSRIYRIGCWSIWASFSSMDQYPFFALSLMNRLALVSLWVISSWVGTLWWPLFLALFKSFGSRQIFICLLLFRLYTK